MNDAQKRFVFEHPLAMLCLERSVMFPDTPVHIRLFESNKSTTARLLLIILGIPTLLHDAA